MVEEINRQYTEWQKDLSIREMRLRPSYFIEKDNDKLDFLLDCIGIKMKTLHRK